MAYIADYNNYKEYLNKKLDEMDGRGRGARAKISRYIGCQTAYTTQVLRGTAHLSLEQGELVNEFLNHSDDEGYLFLLMIQFEKAGTLKLKNRIQNQIDIQASKISTLKQRLHVVEEFDDDCQPTYYSSWLYSAIHAIVSIPGFENPIKISQALSVSQSQAQQILNFLMSIGALKREKNDIITTGKRQVHLNAQSPMITKHHINWRLQAMRHIDNNPQRGLHYSSVVTLSHKDRNLIKNKIIEALKEIKAVVRESKEEDLCCLSLDFFSLLN